MAAAVEDALVTFHGSRGPAPSDEALWANFGWTFGYQKLLDAIYQGESEMHEHETEIPDSEKPKVLQTILNKYWNARSCRGQGVPALAKKDRKARAGTPLRHAGDEPLRGQGVPALAKKDRRARAGDALATAGRRQIFAPLISRLLRSITNQKGI